MGYSISNFPILREGREKSIEKGIIYYHRYKAWGQSLINMRWRKPSERCASATKPSGAFSFLQEITAAPTLRNRPLVLDHFVSPACEKGVVWEPSVDGWIGLVQQMLQLARHITFSDLFGLQNARLRMPRLPLSEVEFISSDLTSKYAISAW